MPESVIATNLNVPVEHTEKRKRQKVAQACDLCRSRKSRCDGAKPICGECAQRPNQRARCRYTSNINRGFEHAGYVSSLLSRIQELENRERDREIANVGLAPVLSHHAQVDPVTVVLPDSLKVLSVVPLKESCPANEASSVDAMGADGHTKSTDQRKDNYFYGGSSAVSFMHQVRATIASRVSDSTSIAPVAFDEFPSRTLNHASTSWVPSMIEEASLTLPSRSLVDEVIQNYWEKVYHLYPFVNKPVFVKAYDNLWAPETARKDLEHSIVGMLGSKSYGSTSIIFHCALNSMLALGAQFMDLPSHDRIKLGDLFAEKARKLCHIDLFDNGSLAMVQSLLLMAQYLQSTPSPSRCWNCTGMACRLAQGLGLHVESKEVHQRLTPLDVEMRRRVWHGCVMLDAVVSMTLGRPLMLYGSPLLPPPQHVNGEDTPDPQMPGHSWLDFYNETIKLYRILADVIFHIYNQSSEQGEQSNKNNSFDVTLEIGDRISQLEAQIPDHLHWGKQRTLRMGTQIAQQASILETRYIHLRILLYRPIFIRFCGHVCAQELRQEVDGLSSDHSSTNISLSISQSLAKACVVQSTKLIDTVYQGLISGTSGAWWYSALYTRTAGTVVLLAMLCDILVEKAEPHILETAWSRCEEVFRLLRECSVAVETYQQGLDALYHRVCNMKRTHRDRGRSSNSAPVEATINNAQQAFEFVDNMSEAAFMSTYDFDWPLGADTTLLDDILGSNA
jgi:hypothetical protein